MFPLRGMERGAIMDLVRTEVTTIFSGDKAEDIVNRIQDEVDYYNEMNG